MVVILIMKIIFSVHFLTYVLILLVILCGRFNYLLIIGFIILFHDLGHIIVMRIYKIKINRIIILPFGSIIDSDIKYNEESYIKFFIGIAGVFNQLLLYLLFYYLYKYGLISYLSYCIFLKYNKYIIVFNLLPIYPLDGLKIVSSLVENIVPYKFHLYFINILSVVSIMLLVWLTKLSFDLLNIIFVLIYKTYEEIFNIKIIFYKFLLERYLYDKEYKHIKYLNSIEKIYKNKYNFINNVSERKILNKLFK